MSIYTFENSDSYMKLSTCFYCSMQHRLPLPVMSLRSPELVLWGILPSIPEQYTCSNGLKKDFST